MPRGKPEQQLTRQPRNSWLPWRRLPWLACCSCKYKVLDAAVQYEQVLAVHVSASTIPPPVILQLQANASPSHLPAQLYKVVHQSRQEGSRAEVAKPISESPHRLFTPSRLDIM